MKNICTHRENAHGEKRCLYYYLTNIDYGQRRQKGCQNEKRDRFREDMNPRQRSGTSGDENWNVPTYILRGRRKLDEPPRPKRTSPHRTRFTIVIGIPMELLVRRTRATYTSLSLPFLSTVITGQVYNINFAQTHTHTHTQTVYRT